MNSISINLAGSAVGTVSLSPATTPNTPAKITFSFEISPPVCVNVCHPEAWEALLEQLKQLAFAMGLVVSAGPHVNEQSASDGAISAAGAANATDAPAGNDAHDGDAAGTVSANLSRDESTIDGSLNTTGYRNATEAPAINVPREGTVEDLPFRSRSSVLFGATDAVVSTEISDSATIRAGPESDSYNDNTAGSMSELPSCSADVHAESEADINNYDTSVSLTELYNDTTMSGSTSYDDLAALGDGNDPTTEETVIKTAVDDDEGCVSASELEYATNMSVSLRFSDLAESIGDNESVKIKDTLGSPKKDGGAGSEPASESGNSTANTLMPSGTDSTGIATSDEEESVTSSDAVDSHNKHYKTGSKPASESGKSTDSSSTGSGSVRLERSPQFDGSVDKKVPRMNARHEARAANTGKASEDSTSANKAMAGEDVLYDESVSKEDSVSTDPAEAIKHTTQASKIIPEESGNAYTYAPSQDNTDRPWLEFLFRPNGRVNIVRIASVVTSPSSSRAVSPPLPSVPFTFTSDCATSAAAARVKRFLQNYEPSDPSTTASEDSGSEKDGGPRKKSNAGFSVDMAAAAVSAESLTQNVGYNADSESSDSNKKSDSGKKPDVGSPKNTGATATAVENPNPTGGSATASKHSFPIGNAALAGHDTTPATRPEQPDSSHPRIFTYLSDEEKDLYGSTSDDSQSTTIIHVEDPPTKKHVQSSQKTADESLANSPVPTFTYGSDEEKDLYGSSSEDSGASNIITTDNIWTAVKLESADGGLRGASITTSTPTIQEPTTTIPGFNTAHNSSVAQGLEYPNRACGALGSASAHSRHFSQDTIPAIPSAVNTPPSSSSPRPLPSAPSIQTSRLKPVTQKDKKRARKEMKLVQKEANRRQMEAAVAARGGRSSGVDRALFRG